MEKTLVIIKPSAISRGLIGEVISRFEKKGLHLIGMKMIELSDEILAEHYAHLAQKPFFQRIKNAMQTTPVIVCCWSGLDAVRNCAKVLLANSPAGLMMVRQESVQYRTFSKQYRTCLKESCFTFAAPIS